MIVIYSTFPTQKEAQSIAQALLDKRLVACANIFSPHHSLYHWEGKIEESQEVAVIFKTKKEHFDAVKTYITTHHAYDVPCVVSWDLADGHPPFMEWIDKEVL